MKIHRLTAVAMAAGVLRQLSVEDIQSNTVPLSRPPYATGLLKRDREDVKSVIRAIEREPIPMDEQSLVMERQRENLPVYPCVDGVHVQSNSIGERLGQLDQTLADSMSRTHYTPGGNYSSMF